MKPIKNLSSPIELGEIVPNISTLLKTNCKKFGNHFVYKEKKNGKFEGILWNDFVHQINCIIGNLLKLGYKKGDKVMIFSPNCLKMLMTELAVMASGGVAVPVFAFYKQEMIKWLMEHSESSFLFYNNETQKNQIPADIKIKHIFCFESSSLYRQGIALSLQPKNFNDLLVNLPNKENHLLYDENPDETCLLMYTSGTMNLPKGVQLSHKNILSQQKALDILWKINHTDRFLSYLPWHHSFGGIFELFTALSKGATIYLESGYGKDPKEIMNNWKEVLPTVFFSVPKVYQALIQFTKEDKEVEKIFFHDKLRFVFTAAAPLPEHISNEFKNHRIPVVEGWGLTETSPCCTLTSPEIKRVLGVVGFPLPGISLKLNEENEILVNGPNVMKGYYKNDESNEKVFAEKEWFNTGDVGEFTKNGLKLICRKDRIFKLTNGEKVIATEVEQIIQKKCHYISFAVVEGSGKDYPVALLFPNKPLLENPTLDIEPLKDCKCPCQIADLSQCLKNCLANANSNLKQKYARIKSFILINDQLSVDNQTLTPSMKVAPNKVTEVYKAHLENLYENKNTIDEEVYIINL